MSLSTRETLADLCEPREKFRELITKRSEVNYHKLKNMDFLQEITLKTLHQWIRNSAKDFEYFGSCDNAFDCRPYKGPKTPPTPSSKYRNNSSYVRKVKQEMNHCRTTSASSWTYTDMLCYLKKYKDLFKIYQKTVDQIHLPETNSLDKGQPKFNPRGSAVFDRCRYGDQRPVSNDVAFYQELIDKHNKSLEMIENAGSRISVKVDLSNEGRVQLNPLSKDHISGNPISELFNTNARNHESNDFPSQPLLAHPMLPDQTFAKTNDTVKKGLHERVNKLKLLNAPLNDTIFEKQQLPNVHAVSGR